MCSSDLRASAFASEVLADGVRRGSDELVVAVSHVSPIKAIVAWALGCGSDITWRMHLDVASVTRIAGRGGRPVLSSFNEIPRRD